MSDLKSRLMFAARGWADANEGAPLSRLGKLVAGDANFFERIDAGGGLNLATLEKFARFLTDPANWPEGCEVPGEVLAFGHVTGISPASTTPSRGNSGESFPLELAPIEIPALLGKREVAA